MTEPVATRDHAQSLLEKIAGPTAVLRPDQWEAIDGLVNKRQRMLVVQRTGWGKSAVYFIAAKILREAGAGPAVIISPLLALMRNQVDSAARAGIRAVTVNSANMMQWDAINAEIAAGNADVILISPERLNNPDFRAETLPQLADNTGLLVIDEAHCISDWGHDFRPDYRRIADLIAGTNPNTPILATTATANDRVVADVQAQLGERTRVLRGNLDRESLRLGVVKLEDSTDRPAWLATHLKDLAGSGIIYALTVTAADELAAALQAAGYPVEAYTGRTEAEERARLEGALQANEVKALVATSALGMGFDKPDLGFVIHVGAPSSPISYYQQVGRAGRGTASAEVILLPGAEDQAIWDYFASVSFPDEGTVRTLLDALGDEPISTVKLETAVDLTRTRIEQTLKVLDVDGAVQRVRGGWVRTGQPWSYDSQRYAGLDAARAAEQKAMRDYIATDGCRMNFLRAQLDDPELDPTTGCGRCDNCTGQHYSTLIDAHATATVTAATNQPGVPLPLRKQWPTGLQEVRGKIRGVEQGKALGRLNDIAHGPALGAFLQERSWQPAQWWRDDQWLRRFVDVLAQWQWSQRPTTVVALGGDPFVERIARAIAQVGQLAFAGTVPELGEPVEAQNSAYRVRGLWHHYDAPGTDLAGVEGTVLLVTDVVDTGWSVTVAGAQLAQQWGVTVLPLAVAVRA